MKLIALALINFGVCFSNLGNAQNDTLCFKIEEAKNLLKYAEKGYFCDSIVFIKNAQDSILREAIEAKDNQLEISARVINGQMLKIKRLKWLAGVVGFCGLAGIIAVLALL